MANVSLIPSQFLASAGLIAGLLLVGGILSEREYRAMMSPRALGMGWAILLLHYGVALGAVAAITGVTFTSVAIGALAASAGLIGRDIAHRWEVDMERAKIIARLTGYGRGH